MSSIRLKRRNENQRRNSELNENLKFRLTDSYQNGRQRPLSILKTEDVLPGGNGLYAERMHAEMALPHGAMIPKNSE